MIFGYKLSKQKDICTFSLSGELIDKNQSAALMTEVQTEIDNGKNLIILNLQELKYINSSGLNEIIKILTKARKAGGDVAICSVNSKISELLVITKLDSIFNICETEEKAIILLNKK